MNNPVNGFKILEMSIRKMAESVGFIKCSSAYFRRYNEKTISCIYLSVNNKPTRKSSADDKSFSLSLNCGIYFKCIPTFECSPIKTKNNRLEPTFSDCCIRRTLIRKGSSIWEHDTAFWSLSRGESPIQVASEIKLEFQKKIVPWFGEFESLDNALKFLLTQEEDMRETFGMGALPCPKRSFSAAHIACELGEYKKASEILLQATAFQEHLDMFPGIAELKHRLERYERLDFMD